MHVHRLATVLASFALAAAASAQTSPYVVMAGDQSRFHVLQGGNVIASWSVPANTAQYQYPIAVTSTIRTMGANAGDVGAEYDLSGNDLGARYTHPAGPIRCWDGTTDGSNFFAIDSGGDVWSFDQNWQNPTQLFDAGGIGAVTYDPINDTLWVSQFSTDTVVQYTRAGVSVSSFSTGHTQNMALALDHADGTLWLHDRTRRGTYEQWTPNGTLLATTTPAGMATENALGGEMPYPGFARCSFRNGTGVNPADFQCVTLPRLGTSWVTSFNTGAGTTATAVAFGLAGPANGPVTALGEVLIGLVPNPVVATGAGNISFPIPTQSGLVGLSLSTQGVRVDTVGGASQVVLLNAQDIVLGN